ncbi:elongation factor P hydroxylase [Marinospirillum sp.]|uniref:elongation factor P hydroxylase n=1 Tax=Marinospirillum sp. TaxID=2183934 RepID=UPI00384FC41E
MTPEEHEYQEGEKLIQLFAELFYDRYQTRLVRGGEEPLYLPASMTGDDHQIIFARGYFTSALHELAHWCVAGEKRRELEDFGYWYLPDGRSAAQQRAFEKVEVRPQAFEQCFTLASGRKFHISADNLSGEPGDTRNFERQVHRLTYQLLFEDQLQGRARILFDAICQTWNNPFPDWQEEARQELSEKLKPLVAGGYDRSLA